MRNLKFFLFLTCFLCLSSFACASGDKPDSVGKGIFFENITFKQALEKAGAEGKQVFIDCFIKTCVPCKYMMRYIFPQEECGEYFNPRYVCLAMDMDEGDGPSVREKYGVGIYPTFLIVNPDGTLFVKELGAVTRNSYMSFVDKMKQAIQRVELANRYKAGERSDAVVRQYISMLHASSDASLNDVVNEFLSTMTVDKLCLKENWEILSAYVTDPEQPAFRRLLASRDSFEAKLGKDVVQNKLMSTYQDEFNMKKMLGLDFDLRISDLEGLGNVGYPTQALVSCMTVRKIIDCKKTDLFGDIIRVIEGIGKLPENGQTAVVKELRGFERIASASQRTLARKALAKLKPSLSAANASVVDGYIRRLSVNK